DRGSGLHRVEHDADLAQRLTKRLRWQPDIGAGADNQRIDALGRGEYTGQRGLIDFLRFDDRPGPDRIRQAQQRAAMRHLGESKAALAVGLDRRRSRKMRSVRGNWHRHFLTGLSGASRWVPTPR